MSRHGQQFNQRQSQRPAHQQVSVKPGAVEEPPMDTVRVPSAATEIQSESDALDADSDRYEAQPGVSETDPLPGESSDITDPVQVEEGAVDFGGFEDIGTRSARALGHTKESVVLERAIQAPVVINRTVAEQEAWDRELEPIIPRKTQMRNYVNGQWYNLVKGQEQFVPRPVAQHFRDKGLV